MSTGASGLAGSLNRSYFATKLHGTGLLLPVNDKVGPEVAHNSGDLPVVIAEVEDSGGEEVEELVTVSHPPGNGRLGGGEEEVPQRVSSVVFKGVEIVDRPRQGAELHKLVCGGFDEESSNQLNSEQSRVREDGQC